MTLNGCFAHPIPPRVSHAKLFSQNRYYNINWGILKQKPQRDDLFLISAPCWTEPACRRLVPRSWTRLLRLNDLQDSRTGQHYTFSVVWYDLPIRHSTKLKIALRWLRSQKRWLHIRSFCTDILSHCAGYDTEQGEPVLVSYFWLCCGTLFKSPNPGEVFCTAVVDCGGAGASSDRTHWFECDWHDDSCGEKIHTYLAKVPKVKWSE